MEVYQYSKQRKDFGRTGQFDDTEIKIVGQERPDPNLASNYKLRNPNKMVFDNIPLYSEHRVSYNFQPFLNN